VELLSPIFATILATPLTVGHPEVEVGGVD
jgi:hypothetical protein